MSEAVAGPQSTFESVASLFQTHVLGDVEAEIKQKKNGSITVIDPTAGTLTYPDLAAFEAHLHEVRPEPIDDDEFEALLNGISIEAVEVEVEPDEDASTPEDVVNNAITELAGVIHAERRGEIGQNSARWHKGRTLAQLEEAAQGVPELAAPGKALAHARAIVEDQLAAAGITDSVDRLNPTEVSITRKAYRVWMQPVGADAEFTLTDAHGNEVRKRLDEIAINKAYKLADLPTPETRDQLLSFAFAQPERNCDALVKIVKQENITSSEEVAALLDDLTGQEDVTTAVRDRIAVSTPPSTVASIAIDRPLYEGDWMSVRRVASEAWAFLGHEVNDEGLMGNTVLLERLLAYFTPRDHGGTAIAKMLVDAGEMDEAQREAFLETLDETLF